MNAVVEMIRDKRREADELLQRHDRFTFGASIARCRREARILTIGLREALRPRLNFHRFKSYESAWAAYVVAYLQLHPEYDPSSTDMTRSMVNGFGRWLYSSIKTSRR